MIKKQLPKNASGLSPIALAKAYTDWALHWSASPTHQGQLVREAVTLTAATWQKAIARKAGESDSISTQDHRFDDPAWDHWPFNAMKESFQACESWYDRAVQVKGMSAHHTHMMRFYARQMLDVLSPSNWPATNPEVLKLGYSSRGRSLANGFQNYLLDLTLQIRESLPGHQSELEPLPYVVGQDVAITPGKVVFRNHLIELIQYLPTTSKVAAQPLLIVPSCIMKYYILDLSPENSMVRFLVGQGYTVFMVSWRNPEESDRNLSLDNYLQTGVLAAMKAVRDSTGESSIHALGYCLGGTFLAIAAAAMNRNDGSLAKDKELPKLASVCLLAALTDFTEPGEMGIFIDEDQVKSLQNHMASAGYLSGKQMAETFRFLNSRELIWSRSTRRYLLGQCEPGNDMMSWNADVTRLPARMHSEYLEKLFLNNDLATCNLLFAGKNVDLMDIAAPLLVVGAVRDHVCPWQSVYKIHELTDTDITFILAAGGHNAGIVSEPGHPKRSFQIAHTDRAQGRTNPAQWQASAPRHEGSWWNALHGWLGTHSSMLVAARSIPETSSLCDAPGQYVMVRHAD